MIPPTTNVSPAPEYRLDLVTGPPRPVPADAAGAALVIARGYGGFNSAMVLGPPQS